MTQSEQGDEPQHPAGRPAHEGAGLPPAHPQYAQALPPQQPPWPAAPGQAAGQVTPPQGQSWDQPWGPAAQQPGAQQQMTGHQESRGGNFAAPQPQAHQQSQGGNYATPMPQTQQSQGGNFAAPQPQTQQQSPPMPMPPQMQMPQAQVSQAQMQPQMPQQPQAPQHSQHSQPSWDMPAAAGGDADATQFIPPVVQGPGALPPENPVAPVAATGSVPTGSVPTGPAPTGPVDGTAFLGQQALRPPAGSDADATQYLPPVPAGAAYAARPEVPLQPGAPGERQPPAEFDSLFRTQAPQAAEAPDAPSATQQMPRFLPPRQQEAEQEEARYQQFQQPGPGAGPGPRRRKVGAVPMIAAVVVGCSVIGLGIGALLNFGGDDTKTKGDDTKTVASGSSLPAQQPAGQDADPAKAQAVALDKLLADSNDSREQVINAVAAISRCDSLPKAATDLRAAAEQRRGLVTRLQTLKVDKLDGHASLTASLNTAWQASAAADDHYAAWADRVAGDPKKFCSKGRAKATGERRLGDRESGNASRAKKAAVDPWNEIAAKYGLTKHQPTEL
ncbi:hypothetical protein [Streptomyces sp. NPDC058657]|uniref:hypothetical protein n=1 Tax=unclassified Streptomyces TaxID=2593676 RepID=UPI00365F8D01